MNMNNFWKDKMILPKMDRIYMSLDKKFLILFCIFNLSLTFSGYTLLKTNLRKKEISQNNVKQKKLVIDLYERRDIIKNLLLAEDLSRLNKIEKDMKKDKINFNTAETDFSIYGNELKMLEERIILLQKKNLQLTETFSEIYKKEKSTRHLLRDKIYINKDYTETKALGNIIYKSKEAIFQYKDKEHFDHWKLTIETLMESTTDSEVLKTAKNYYNISQNITDILLTQNTTRVDIGSTLDSYSKILKIIDSEVKLTELRITKDLSKIAEESDEELFEFVLILIISIIILMIFIHGHLIKPLKSIKESLKEVSNKNFNHKINIFRKDEIGEVADHFNKMVENLKTIYHNLEKNGREKAHILEKHNLELMDEINERKKLEKKLKTKHGEIHNLAYRDSLTSLHNRRYFYENFDSLMKNKYEKIVLIILDIDNFKEINDHLGHDAGDFVLKKLAVHINKSLPEESVVARLGGDEFIAAFPYNNNRIKPILKKLKKVFSKPLKIFETDVPVSGSMGVKIGKTKKENLSTLMKHADLALYRSKKRGKNKITIYTPEINKEFLQEIEKAKELTKALKNNEFFMVYQPFHEISKNKNFGLESLIRWKHPEKGVLTPYHFIEDIEKLGLEMEMTEIVLKNVCKDLKELDKKLKVSININGSLFNSSYFFERFITILEETKTDPKRIMLEITENSLVKNLEWSNKYIEDLKKLGTEVWIDDFGTGYSSLAYLKDIPTTGLKIDKRFIDEIANCIDSYNLLKGILQMADVLNMKVIIEGVETNDQYRILQDLECDVIQGYYISRPAELNKIKTFMLNYEEDIEKIDRTSQEEIPNLVISGTL